VIIEQRLWVHGRGTRSVNGVGCWSFVAARSDGVNDLDVRFFLSHGDTPMGQSEMRTITTNDAPSRSWNRDLHFIRVRAFLV
jgi:hypothetical protein